MKQMTKFIVTVAAAGLLAMGCSASDDDKKASEGNDSAEEALTICPAITYPNSLPGGCTGDEPAMYYPSNLQVTPYTTRAYVTWSQPTFWPYSQPDYWRVQWGTADDPGFDVTTGHNSINLTGLTPNTTYYLNVFSGFDALDCVHKVTFTTPLSGCLNPM